MQCIITTMLKRSENDNKFCVPAALALILDISVSESVMLIKEELGDTEITGVFHPIILKIITQQGWTYKLAPFTTKHHIFLIVFKGHVGVYREGIYIDNQQVNVASTLGTAYCDSIPTRFGKVEHIFLCEPPTK